MTLLCFLVSKRLNPCLCFSLFSHFFFFPTFHVFFLPIWYLISRLFNVLYFGFLSHYLSLLFVLHFFCHSLTLWPSLLPFFLSLPFISVCLTFRTLSRFPLLLLPPCLTSIFSFSQPLSSSVSLSPHPSISLNLLFHPFPSSVSLSFHPIISLTFPCFSFFSLYCLSFPPHVCFSRSLSVVNKRDEAETWSCVH